MKFQIVTVSNHRPTENYYCHDECFLSALKYGHQIENLHRNGEYKGLISKPKILKRRFEDGTINCDLLLFVDCWDVLFLQNPSMAIDCWKLYGSDILFNAEKNLFPRRDLIDSYPDKGTPYRFLNSGVFIGAADAIYKFLEEMNLDSIPDDYQQDGIWHHSNDQGNALETFAKSKMNLSLDRYSSLCQTLHGVGPDEVEIIEEDGEVLLRNKITNTRPVMAHANGGGKDGPVMPELIKQWRMANP